MENIVEIEEHDILQPRTGLQDQKSAQNVLASQSPKFRTQGRNLVQRREISYD